MASYDNWGDYFWPDQIDECLRNKLDVHDPEELRLAERDWSFARGVQLLKGDAATPQTHDLDHLRAIHRHLFQDVYEWAGELRATELVRPSTDPNAPPHEFIKPEMIEPAAETIFPLANARTLAALDRDQQVEQLAKVYAGLNVLHPFVEGNGRTQRIFLEDLAEHANLALDWSQMPRQNEVMAEAFTVGYEPVLQALKPCVVQRQDPDNAANVEAFTAARLAAVSYPTPPGVPSAKALQAENLPNRPERPSRLRTGDAAKSNDEGRVQPR